MKIYLTLILLFVLISCSNEVDTDKLSKIYVKDILSKEQFGDDYKSYKENFRKILTEYGYTEESYKGSLEQMKDNSEQWDEFFDKSMTYLKELKAEADSTERR